MRKDIKHDKCILFTEGYNKEVIRMEEYLHKRAEDINVKSLRTLVPQLLAEVVYDRDHLKTKKKRKWHMFRCL